MNVHEIDPQNDDDVRRLYTERGCTCVNARVSRLDDPDLPVRYTDLVHHDPSCPFAPWAFS